MDNIDPSKYLARGFGPLEPKLIIFDKDGTLIEPIAGDTFPVHPEDQQLREGVAQQLVMLKMRLPEVKIAIASNQAGVEAGHKTLEEAKAEIVFAKLLVEEQGLEVGWTGFCPDFLGKLCHFITPDHDRWQSIYDDSMGYRKPRPGMLMAAINCFGIGWSPADVEQWEQD